MSLSLLASTQSYPPVPRPITPTPSLARTEGTKQPPPQLDHLPWTAPFRDGLPTPPSDMNGVAYNSLPPSNYAAKLDGLPRPSYTKQASYSLLPSEPSNAMARSTNQRSQQPSVHDAPAYSFEDRKKSYSTTGSSYVRVPSSISSSKENLAEFTAQMTCLFWFESTAKLRAIEDRLNPVPFLIPEAFPTAGFQKWVTNVLSTTQVSQNVVLLALMFVYRLKKFNPGVRGKRGSEYRLMTIALMLGNKFLDDNTYTNKTWAEVSGISVQEIHVMEVEFLSNVRYNLYASEEQWAQWHVKLGLFSDFLKSASLAEKNPSPGLNISPSLGPSTRTQLPSPSSKLPSPPASDPLRPQNWHLPLDGPSYSAAPPYGAELPPSSSRKRAREEPVEEHPSKRMAPMPSMATSMPTSLPTTVSSLPPSSALTSIPALPPVLAPTSTPSHQPMHGASSRLPRPNFPPSSQAFAPSIPSIPTTLPQYPSTTSRSMPPVMPPSSNWTPQTSSTAMPPMANGLYNNPISLPDPGRLNASPFGASSATLSPAISAYSVHTPQTHLSPSYFLANRNSPYRPVRTVNTLLIPPPSSSLQQQRNIPFDHMHYQPLGKPAAERKTGLLPYLQHEAWPQGQYLHPTYHTNPAY